MGYQKQQIPSFISKLDKLLGEAPSDVISWTPDNNGFIVHDPTVFTDEYLPKYFKSTNFSSFIRQANFYAFKKVSGSSRIPWMFIHEHFIRGRPDLMRLIKRKTSPDFYKASVEQVENLKTTKRKLEDQVQSLQKQLQAAMATIEKYRSQEQVISKPQAAQDHDDCCSVSTAEPDAKHLRGESLDTHAQELSLIDDGFFGSFAPSLDHVLDFSTDELAMDAGYDPSFGEDEFGTEALLV